MKKWIDIKKKFPTQLETRSLLFLNVFDQALYEGFVNEAKIHVLSKDGYSYRLLKYREEITHWLMLPKLPKICDD